MIDDVREIVGTLRDIRLDWMADEIELTIRTGKTVRKEIEPGIGRDLKNPTITLPFTDEEELAICMRTIRAYFVDLPKVWTKTEHIFGDVLAKAATTQFEGVQLLDGDGGKITPFTQAYSRDCHKLDALLERAGF